MSRTILDKYKSWGIRVTGEQNRCANFSFDIISPEGRVQHVKMGGESEKRALERAREMIDLERAFLDNE